MDGTKWGTDTAGPERDGRQALFSGRSVSVKRCGPRRDENPGGSRSDPE